MAKANEPVEYIQAIVEKAIPDRVQYKPYYTELSFDGKLVVEIPVPKSEITKKGDKIILTLEGYMTLLKNYLEVEEQMHINYRDKFK